MRRNPYQLLRCFDRARQHNKKVDKPQQVETGVGCNVIVTQHEVQHHKQHGQQGGSDKIEEVFNKL